MKRILIILTVIFVTIISCKAQKQRFFTFDSLNSSGLLSWSSHLTGKGKECKWKIIDDNNNKVLAQVSTETEDYRFNVIVNDNLQYENVEIRLKFKAIEGKGDQGGGPIWRYQDENNYYVARANPLENNFRVYKVVNGRRIQLKSAIIKMEANKWYNIKIVMNNQNIKCYFNDKLEMETNDNSFKNAGKIGLWTKSDAVTYFDNLEIIPIK